MGQGETRTHLSHLGVQALAHLNTPMRQQHSAVDVDVGQCAGLVQELGETGGTHGTGEGLAVQELCNRRTGRATPSLS